MRILGILVATCFALTACGGSDDSSDSGGDEQKPSAAASSEPAPSDPAPSEPAATEPTDDPADDPGDVPAEDPDATVQSVADAIGCTFPSDLDTTPTANTIYPCQESENQLQISYWAQSRAETEQLLGALDPDTYFFVNDSLTVAGFDAAEVAQARSDLGP